MPQKRPRGIAGFGNQVGKDFFTPSQKWNYLTPSQKVANLRITCTSLGAVLN
jgi:hypothetical protein